MSGDWTNIDERNYGLAVQQLKTQIRKLERGIETARPEMERLRAHVAALRKRRVWP